MQQSHVAGRRRRSRSGQLPDRGRVDADPADSTSRSQRLDRIQRPSRRAPPLRRSDRLGDGATGAPEYAGMNRSAKTTTGTRKAPVGQAIARILGYRAKLTTTTIAEA